MNEKELIMVVEDSESLNNFISQNLIDNGFEVIQCFNAKEAYKKLSKNYISLVILDLNLGDDIGGMRVLHSIRLQSSRLRLIASPINISCICPLLFLHYKRNLNGMQSFRQDFAVYPIKDCPLVFSLDFSFPLCYNFLNKFAWRHSNARNVPWRGHPPTPH